MKLFHRHNRAFWTPMRLRSLWMGIALLAASIIVQLVAGPYASGWALRSGYSHDLFLDHLPVVGLGPVIVTGGIATWVIGWWLLVTRPRDLVFGMKAIALFIIARAFFMSLTHMGAYPQELAPGPHNFGWDFYRRLTFQGDFFFSGHTGFPFLMALLLWNERGWRIAFIAASFFFGAAVLLAHVHYSIDVFAAPFIVYGVYVIAQKWFPEDYRATQEGNLPR